MSFWDNAKKDFRQSLKESVHLLKEKAIIIKEKADELTHAIYDFTIKFPKEEIFGCLYP